MGPISTYGRALLCLALSLVCLLAAAAPARADEGRAQPHARSYPRGFGSYDDLVAFATQVAHDQTALDTDLNRTHADGWAIDDLLTPAQPFRGGILYAEAEVKARRAVDAELRARLEALASQERQLVAAGARLEPPDAAWRMPAAGALTQPFGPTGLRLEPGRVWGGVPYAHFHNGVDIGAPWGSPVVAPADGRVAFVGHMGDGAEVVVLAHAGGRVSLFAHLADVAGWSPPVVAGDTVKAGDRIGSIGTTGVVTGAHLHWSVYADGALVDPLSLTR